MIKMVMKSKHKIIIFITVNLMLFILLYCIPIDSNILNKLCLVKKITGKECWNCGMTRAFLSVIHMDLKMAYEYNAKFIIVLPFTIGIYTYSWLKYIFLERGMKNERKS